jgi:NAD(P)-dependent dehydrogenase (short-subunit alcohol dehydrogenase family)
VSLRHDVTSEARRVEVVAERRYGRLDVLFSNAGIAILGSLFEMSLDDSRAVRLRK